MSAQSNEQFEVEGVLQAEVPGAKDEDYRVLALAHPLNKEDLLRLGLDTNAITRPGTKVAVYKDHARTLITAGYVQVDPEDKAAVRAAMRGEAPAGETPPQGGPGENTNVTRTEPVVPSAVDDGTPGDGPQDLTPAPDAAKKSGAHNKGKAVGADSGSAPVADTTKS